MDAGPDYWKNSICLKVFLKERRERGAPYFYLAVSTDCTMWSITDSLDSKSCYLQSSSAGAACPAAPSNAINTRVGRKSWLFFDSKGKLQEESIRLCCDTHRYPDSQQVYKPCTGINPDASTV